MNYIGGINNTGYGIASASLLSQLDLDINIKSTSYQKDSEDIKELLPDLKFSDPNPESPTFIFWHLGHADQFIVEGSENTLYTTFETDAFAPHELSSFQRFDKFATATEWGVSVLQKYTDKPVYKIEHAFNLEENKAPFNIEFISPLQYWITRLHPDDRFILDKNPTILSNCGKFEIRKGTPELIHCLTKTEVEIKVLVLSVHNPWAANSLKGCLVFNTFQSVSTRKELGYSLWKQEDRNKVTYIIDLSPVATRKQLYTDIGHTDYFISLSKGEGWNLPLFDMLSLSVRCLATNIPAHKEYLVDYTKDLLIEPAEKVTALDGTFFRGDKGKWYNINKSDILDKLNLILTTEIPYTFKSNLTWQQSARKIRKILQND